MRVEASTKAPHLLILPNMCKELLRISREQLQSIKPQECKSGSGELFTCLDLRPLKLPLLGSINPVQNHVGEILAWSL